MGIEDLLFICPLLRHLAGKPNEGISVEDFEHLVDGDFEIDGEFISWDINEGDTGGTDMVNWKERVKRKLEKGHQYYMCGQIELDCNDCPFNFEECGCLAGSNYEEAAPFVFRHLLATVKDWTDVSEIRARIAEMLDEETRRKFLGKPEPKTKYVLKYWCADLEYIPRAGYPGRPSYRYHIAIEKPGVVPDENICGFRDEDMAHRVLEFLNGEAE